MLKPQKNKKPTNEDLAPVKSQQMEQLSQKNEKLIKQLQEFNKETKKLTEGSSLLKEVMQNKFLHYTEEYSDKKTSIATKICRIFMDSFTRIYQYCLIVESQIQKKLNIYNPIIEKLYNEYNEKVNLMKHYHKKLEVLKKGDTKQDKEKYKRNVQKQVKVYKQYIPISNLLVANFETFQMQTKGYLDTCFQEIMIKLCQSSITSAKQVIHNISSQKQKIRKKINKKQSIVSQILSEVSIGQLDDDDDKGQNFVDDDEKISEEDVQDDLISEEDYDQFLGKGVKKNQVTNGAGGVNKANEANKEKQANGTIATRTKRLSSLTESKLGKAVSKHIRLNKKGSDQDRKRKSRRVSNRVSLKRKQSLSTKHLCSNVHFSDVMLEKSTQMVRIQNLINEFRYVLKHQTQDIQSTKVIRSIYEDGLTWNAVSLFGSNMPKTSKRPEDYMQGFENVYNSVNKDAKKRNKQTEMRILNKIKQNNIQKQQKAKSTFYNNQANPAPELSQIQPQPKLQMTSITSSSKSQSATSLHGQKKPRQPVSFFPARQQKAAALKICTPDKNKRHMDIAMNNNNLYNSSKSLHKHTSTKRENNQSQYVRRAPFLHKTVNYVNSKDAFLPEEEDLAHHRFAVNFDRNHKYISDSNPNPNFNSNASPQIKSPSSMPPPLLDLSQQESDEITEDNVMQIYKLESLDNNNGELNLEEKEKEDVKQVNEFSLCTSIQATVDISKKQKQKNKNIWDLFHSEQFKHVNNSFKQKEQEKKKDKLRKEKQVHKNNFTENSFENFLKNRHSNNNDNDNDNEKHDDYENVNNKQQSNRYNKSSFGILAQMNQAQVQAMSKKGQKSSVLNPNKNKYKNKNKIKTQQNQLNIQVKISEVTFQKVNQPLLSSLSQTKPINETDLIKLKKKMMVQQLFATSNPNFRHSYQNFNDSAQNTTQFNYKDLTQQDELQQGLNHSKNKFGKKQKQQLKQILPSKQPEAVNFDLFKTINFQNPSS